jgi:WD40 repeat protein
VRSRCWILSVVLCLVAVSGVWAQEENVKQLTPVVLDEVLGIDGHISDVAFCHQNACLVYINKNNYQVSLVDFSDPSHIATTLINTIPHTDETLYLQISPDDRYASFAASDQKVYVWDMASNEVLQIPTQLKSIYENPPFLSWYQIGITQYLMLKVDVNEGEVWNMKTRQILPTDNRVPYWLSDSRFATFRNDGVVWIQDTATGNPIQKINTESFIETIFVDETNARIYIINNDFVSQGKNRFDSPKYNVTLWDTESGTLLFTFPQIKDPYLFSLSEDGSRVFLGDGDGWVMWDVRTYRLITEFIHVEDNVFLDYPSWNQEGSLVLTVYIKNYSSSEGCLEMGDCEYGSYIWDAKTGERITTRTEMLHPWSRWMPNGHWLLAHMDDKPTFAIWDAYTGQTLYEIESPESILNWNINHDGTKLFALGEEHAYLWTLPQP